VAATGGRNMLRTVLTLSLTLGLIVGLSKVFAADEEKTLKGTITCAKCDLKVEGQTKCATVIKVKEGDKDVIYYFDADSHKKHHPKVCNEAKEGEVVGTVSEKDGKKQVKVSKVEFK